MIERVPVRILLAIFVFMLAVIGMYAGVELSERTFSENDGVLVFAYYSLSLFVIGGVDLGTPVGGPALARAGLWLAYFAAPILTVSAILDAIFRVVSRDKFRLLRARGHVVCFGTGELAEAMLRRLHALDPKLLVVVVCDGSESRYRLAQLSTLYGSVAVVSDVVDEYLLRKIRVRKASRVLVLGQDSFGSYELAHQVLQKKPALAGKVLLHCERLRFMRAMADTEIASNVVAFNSFQRAASLMVRTVLMPLLLDRSEGSCVVIAGFGRFGQSILEELQALEGVNIPRVVILAEDAERRIMVTKEQVTISSEFELHSFQGDISNPQVWSDLAGVSAISDPSNLFVLATDRGADNLRTALWLRRQNAVSPIFARTSDGADFAATVAAQQSIDVVRVNELVGEYTPRSWLLDE